VELRVIGCHGGETPSHKTSAFLVDDRLAIDAGALTSGLELSEQARIEACLVSHAHLDHVRDLATLADNRCQLGCPPLVVAGAQATIDALRAHFFNNVIWPDFSVIPTPTEPTIRFVPLAYGEEADVAGYRVRSVEVTHTIDSSGFVVARGDKALAYSGDTGPTELFWEVLSQERRLRALLMEVSFPNRHARLAEVSGHHTPSTLAVDLQKLRGHRELPVWLYHIKPAFQAEVERECARIGGHALDVLALGDHFTL
jgi:cAMP phosphodiesterase